MNLKFEKAGSTFDVFYKGCFKEPMGNIRKFFIDGQFVGYKFYPASITYGYLPEVLEEITEKLSSLNKTI